MNTSKKLVFFGNERLATSVSTSAPTLRALVNAGYEIEAVIASHVEGVSRQKRDLEIGSVAHAYHIPVILTAGRIPLYDEVKKYQASAGVLVAFGRIIPKKVIDHFPDGIINIHPSLLPRLRGSTPIETAILEGLPETGVSLMRLSEDMDAGPVYDQATVKLSGRESKKELSDKLLDKGSKLLLDNLEAILLGSLEPKPQNDSRATYTKLIKKEDGLMDFGQPAQKLERQVRAFAGWPSSTAEVFGQKIIVINARIAKDELDGALVIKANPGWLEIEELIAPSGRKISGADFIRGYRKS